MTVTSDRKQDILKAAIEIILADGVAGLTIRKVADAAGISTGLVLYHFESKERLVEEAWRTAVLKLGERIDASRGPDYGRAWIEATFRVRFLERDETAVPGLLWLEYWRHVARTLELRLDHSKDYDEWRRIEGESLAKAITEGQLRRDLDPALIVDMFHSIVCGLLVKTAVDAEAITAERAYEIGRFFLALISPPDSDGATPGA